MLLATILLPIFALIGCFALPGLLAAGTLQSFAESQRASIEAAKREIQVAESVYPASFATVLPIFESAVEQVESAMYSWRSRFGNHASPREIPFQNLVSKLETDKLGVDTLYRLLCEFMQLIDKDHAPGKELPEEYLELGIHKMSLNARREELDYLRDLLLRFEDQPEDKVTTGLIYALIEEGMAFFDFSMRISRLRWWNAAILASRDPLQRLSILKLLSKVQQILEQAIRPHLEELVSKIVLLKSQIEATKFDANFPTMYAKLKAHDPKVLLQNLMASLASLVSYFGTLGPNQLSPFHVISIVSISRAVETIEKMIETYEALVRQAFERLKDKIRTDLEHFSEALKTVLPEFLDNLDQLIAAAAERPSPETSEAVTREVQLLAGLLRELQPNTPTALIETPVGPPVPTSSAREPTTHRGDRVPLAIPKVQPPIRKKSPKPRRQHK